MPPAPPGLEFVRVVVLADFVPGVRQSLALLGGEIQDLEAADVRPQRRQRTLRGVGAAGGGRTGGFGFGTQLWAILPVDFVQVRECGGQLFECACAALVGLQSVVGRCAHGCGARPEAQ